MATRLSTSISFLAFALALSGACDAQLMQRRVVVPSVTPAADAPPTDPASAPPADNPPPAAVPAPTSVGAGAPPSGPGQGAVQRLPPPDRAGAGVAMGSPGATMAAWYERLPGCAKRISIASLTQIYVIGCSDALDTRTFHWQYDTWQPLAADAHAIAAVDGLPFKKNRFNNLLSGLLAIPANGNARFVNYTGGYIGAGYTKIQEAASGGGWIWAINEASGDHLGGTIRRSDGVPEAECVSTLGAADTGTCSDYKWYAFGDLYARRIAAGLSDATAWVIGEDGRIYRQVNTGDGWIEKPGCATAIANAGKDDVWVIGCDAADAAGNRSIYQWDGSTWVKRPGAGVEIALQPDGKPWLLQADGSIWRLR
jgi:hypothetical protein